MMTWIAGISSTKRHFGGWQLKSMALLVYNYPTEQHLAGVATEFPEKAEARASFRSITL